MTAWYTLRLLPSEAAKQALGLLEMEPNVELGNKVGNHATLLNAEISQFFFRKNVFYKCDFTKKVI